MARSAAIGEACRLELGFERYRFPGFTVRRGGDHVLTSTSLRTTAAAPVPAGDEAGAEAGGARARRHRAHEPGRVLPDRVGPDGVRAAAEDHRPGRGAPATRSWPTAWGSPGRPDRAQLLFERFINEARAPPDIDIDFDVNRREEVIQYLYDKYGADHAAMVCTIVTYRARNAVREVVMALGFLPRIDGRPRRSTPARPATWHATWRSTAASRGCSPSSGSTWPPPRSRRAATDAPSTWPGHSSETRGHTRRGRIAAAPNAPLADPATVVHWALAAQAASARRIGHVGAPRSLETEALRAERGAGRRGAGSPDAARQRLARTDRGARRWCARPESGMPVEPRRRVPVVPEMPEEARQEASPRRPTPPAAEPMAVAPPALCRDRRLPRHLGIHVGGMPSPARRSSNRSRSSARRCPIGS